jgi:hypothetical protein
MRCRTAILASLTVLLLIPDLVKAETLSAEIQIAGAVSAAPEDRRAGAKVLAYSGEGDLIVLRQGTNELICLADDPGDDRFHAACYHQSLEPYMLRGREMRAAGIESGETLNLRHQEADAGKLEMPSEPATIYNLGGPLSILDPETGQVTGGHWVWSVYIPYATEESTGLPTTPQIPGAPWIMRPGTASAHIMVVQPREPEKAGSVGRRR